MGMALDKEKAYILEIAALKVALTDEIEKRRKAAEDCISELVPMDLPYHCPYCGSRMPWLVCKECKYLQKCVSGSVIGCPICLGCEKPAWKPRVVK